MSIYSGLTRRALVRWQYGDDATLRGAMGPAEPLLVLACAGPLDAPENMPAGSHKATRYGPQGTTAHRDTEVL